MAALRPSLVSNDDELTQILALNRANVKGALTEEVKKDSGFLTLLYSAKVLHAMHRLMPSVIVKDGSMLVAYALTTAREAGEMDPHLAAMQEHVDAVLYDGKPLRDQNYYIMGQICVHPAYRGKGVFQLLYDGHRAFYGNRFDMLVTDISTGNKRSLRAHERTGFKTVETYRDEMDEWQVVVWDWRKKQSIGGL